MTIVKKWLKDGLLASLANVVVRFVTPAHIYCTHQKFVICAERRNLIPQSRKGKWIAYFVLAAEHFGKRLRMERNQWLLHHYSKLIGLHYGKSGIAYSNLANMTTTQVQEEYKNLDGRLKYFIKKFPKIISYQDKDSFLELGCGKGQNIKDLLYFYPSSNILGIDISENSINFLKKVGTSNLVDLQVGSITDFTLLKSLQKLDLDHVVLCHMFSLLFESDIEQTKALRQKVVDHLIELAGKSVIIIDSKPAVLGAGISAVPEQKTRCYIKDDLSNYFEKHASLGSCIFLNTATSSAAYWLRN